MVLFQIIFLLSHLFIIYVIVFINQTISNETHNVQHTYFLRR